jgi:hypothetical protein
MNNLKINKKAVIKYYVNKSKKISLEFFGEESTKSIKSRDQLESMYDLSLVNLATSLVDLMFEQYGL